jgi:hypothetical protein
MKKIIEQTSSGASGSFETQMGSGMVRRNFHPFFNIDSEEVQPKKKKKQLNKKKKPMKKITISEIENIILKTLIHEEVYSEKPIEPKGRDISSKNAKSKVTTKTSKKIDDITVKSGKESKSDVSGRTKKVSASLKNNLKGAEVKDVNKFKKVDYDYETEAYQNGMEDITYDRISDEQREKNTKYIKSAEMRKNPNAEKSGKAADKMIKQVKDREATRNESPYRNAQQMGGDIEFYDKQNQKNNGKKLIPRKKLGMNENSIKRLTFKSQFRDDKDMLRKIPSNYRKNDLVFEMYDGDSNYKVRWEGTENNGVGVIIEHKSASKEMKNMKMFESLTKFERLDFQSERNVQSSNLNENQIFKQMLNQSRRLMNEGPDDPETMPDASTQVDKQMLNYDKEAGVGNVKSSSENVGIDTGIKNNLPDYGFGINGVIKDTIVVPAPTDEDLLGYNQILRGEAPATISDNEVKINFEVQYNAPNGKASDKMGSYFPLGKEQKVDLPQFRNTGAILTGAGTGRILTSDNVGGKRGGEILDKQEKAYGASGIIIPAPDTKVASNIEQITKYNDSLVPYLKEKYPKFGLDIEWIPDAKTPLSFIEGKYNVKGEKSAGQTGEGTSMFNYFNDRAYTYMKIGNDVYYQKQGIGKDKADPKQYTKVNPTTQKTAFDAINALTFTPTGAKP